MGGLLRWGGGGGGKGYVAPPSQVIGGPAPLRPPSSYAYVVIYVALNMNISVKTYYVNLEFHIVDVAFLILLSV